MSHYKTMGTDQIMHCIVALILGMLLANMLKNVCGCKVVEGQHSGTHSHTHHHEQIFNTDWHANGHIEMKSSPAAILAEQRRARAELNQIYTRKELEHHHTSG